MMWISGELTIINPYDCVMTQELSSVPPRRLEVQDVAARLFAGRGYRGTSMKDIANALGVTAPNLYNHVTSKPQVLFDVMDVAMDRAIRELEAALDGVEDHSDQLQLATESLVLEFLRHPAEVTVCNTEIRSLGTFHRNSIIAKRDRYASRFRKVIDDGCAAGRFRTATPRIAAYAILEMGNSAKAWFKPGDELVDTAVACHYGEFARRIVEEAERPQRLPMISIG